MSKVVLEWKFVGTQCGGSVIVDPTYMTNTRRQDGRYDIKFGEEKLGKKVITTVPDRGSANRILSGAISAASGDASEFSMQILDGDSFAPAIISVRPHNRKYQATSSLQAG